MPIVRELVTKWTFKADTASVKQFDAAITQTKKDIRNVAIALTGAAAAAAVFVREAGRFEQSQIAFETMLGSAEKANQVLRELADFAARTPFTLPGVEQSAKQLLAVGVETESLLPILKSLGDVSAGLSVPLSRLVLNFGQVRAQGKLTGRELRDFAIAGVPLASELAKNLGVAESEIANMVSRGEIGFDETRQAFESLTTGSGRFADLMTKQSQSFFGILSNIQDSLIILAREIGQSLLPAAKEIAKEFMLFVEVNKDLIKQNLVDLMIGLGKAVKGTFKFARNLFGAIDSLVKPFGGLATVIKNVTKAMLAFFAIRFITNIGFMVGGIARASIAFASFSRIIRTLQLRALLLGSVFLGTFLIIEDMVAFFQGRESFFGDFFGDLFDLDNLSVENVVSGLVKALFRAIKGASQAGADILNELFDGLALGDEALRQVYDVGKDIGAQLGAGIADGVTSIGGSVLDFLNIPGFFTGPEVAPITPEQFRQSLAVEKLRSPSPLEKERPQSLGTGFLGGSIGSNSTVNQNFSPTITVNAGAGADPTATANAVKRVIDDAGKEQLRNAQNALRPGTRR